MRARHGKGLEGLEGGGAKGPTQGTVASSSPGAATSVAMCMCRLLHKYSFARTRAALSLPAFTIVAACTDRVSALLALVPTATALLDVIVVSVRVFSRRPC